MKDKKIDNLVQRSYGMAEDQNLEEFEAAEREVTQEDRKASQWEALKKRKDEEYKNSPKE